jgi:hypothetical protein
MIADSVEAISRILDDPNPARLASVVHDVAMRRLKEGQLDECGVTMKELKQVETAMVRVLLGARHGRIKYPKPAASDLVGLAIDESSARLLVAAELADGPGTPSAAALGHPEQDGADVSI